MTPEDVAAACGLSDDSLEKLRLYAALLLKWQKKVKQRKIKSSRKLPCH